MKKVLLSFAIALFTFSALDLSAQDKLAVRAGWNNAATVNDGNQVAGDLSNFYLGVYRNNKFAGILALYTGLEYFQNGWKTDDNNFRKLHYLSVPIGLRVKLGPVFAIAGPALNFKVGETYKKAGVEIDNKSNSFDLPLFIGVGLKIAVVTIEARYHWGTLDVNNGNMNQYLQIGAGIGF